MFLYLKRREIKTAIFAQNLRGTMDAAEEWWEDRPRPINKEELPQFRSFSDVMLTYWLHNSPEPKYLRYCFVTHIMNDETLNIITQILRNTREVTDKTKIPYWPGITRSMEDEGENDFLALLGRSYSTILGSRH